MYRSGSPALSENEVDISNSLFDDGAQHVSDSEEAFGDFLDTPRLKDTAQHGGVAQDEDEDEDEAFIAARQAAANRNTDGKTPKKAGAFQTMGLNAHILKAIAKKGFTIPTPIQRKTIPMIMDGQDVVGMARTGSGKTAAFVIPMIEKLISHSAKVGARAIILSPTRELALQTLKVVKELGKGTDLRAILLVGGDSLEDQFSSMASNPDIIIATPGRFQHLKVEMGLELSSVQYVVFDEADRLFEMGFATQLTEIMHSLPSSRQTMLFSATLPKSLVEFARAGLQEPKLIRLDAESKIAPGLESVFFTVQRAEKEGAVLHVLQEVIKMPLGPANANQTAKDSNVARDKKRKRGVNGPPASEAPSQHSTVIFVATKHHVEYLTPLLKAFGYSTSYVYGSLDQTARKLQIQDFRTGVTNIMVVTDVAARGLDIPVLANVINYDFPSQPKTFVHRVGRTARAGKAGWSYSLITTQDVPYLLDLQLFLSRKLILGRSEKEGGMFKECVVVGGLIRDRLETYVEEVNKLLDEDDDLTSLREVTSRSEKQYLRTRNSAAAESVKRAKQIAHSDNFKGVNMLFADGSGQNVEQQRADMLARVSGFRPQETVFEIGRRGNMSEAATVMKKHRAKVEARKAVAEDVGHGDSSSKTGRGDLDHETNDEPIMADFDSEEELVLTAPSADMDEASEDELELTFTGAKDQRKASKGRWQDTEHFMAYTPSSLNLAEDRGYGVHSGGVHNNFVEAAQGATMDLVNDETKAFAEPSKQRGMRWDKKSKKYVSRANDEDGSKGAKMILSESGQKIPASFRSGRFDAWRKANKIDRLPRVGELERKGSHFSHNNPGGQRYKHKMERAPKEADKYRDDYHVRKKRVSEAKEKRIGRFADGQGKNELRGVDDVRKARKLAVRRREKNARPSRRA